VLAVIPGAASVKTYVVADKELLPANGENRNGPRVYAGYDGNGDLVGIAAEGVAQGYADAVRVLYAYSPACQCITGFRVVSSRETPGFGDKLATDPEFLANFRELDATLNAAGDGLANAIVTVKHGTKTKPWQIDAISGATISSRAAGRAVNDSAARVVPALQPHLDELRRRTD
jgi:electron transport complex protein RnfG